MFQTTRIPALCCLFTGALLLSATSNADWAPDSFFDITYDAIGNAGIEESGPGALLVDNLGSSGKDGVRLAAAGGPPYKKFRGHVTVLKLAGTQGGGGNGDSTHRTIVKDSSPRSENPLYETSCTITTNVCHFATDFSGGGGRDGAYDVVVRQDGRVIASGTGAGNDPFLSLQGSQSLRIDEGTENWSFGYNDYAWATDSIRATSGTLFGNTFALTEFSDLDVSVTARGFQPLAVSNISIDQHFANYSNVSASNISIQAIPEPTSGLVVAGLLMVGIVRRRR